MPFTFKLSMRLALIRALVAAAAAAFVACELPVRRVTDPNSPNDVVVQVFTSPDSVTLDPYEVQQFLAFGRTQAGDSVPVAVRWSTTGGTISTGGLYTADASFGTYQVTATATTSPIKSSSTVRNRGQLTQVFITPSAASVAAGGKQQFAAYGRKRNGDSVAVNVSYAATGGIISAAGLYSAGQSAGNYRVIAVSNPAALADTAAVTISVLPVMSVAVTPATASEPVGQTVSLTATPEDSLGGALIGRLVTWASSAAAVATVDGNGQVTGVAAGLALITATSEGQSGTALITVTAPVVVTNPAPVTDLAVSGVTTTALTLSFTEVNDGTGQPAKYDFRYAVGTIVFGSATDVAQGTCVRPVLGTSIGARRSCTILGLQAGTGYQVQLVSYRGTLDSNAVFGPLSNVASGTTAASTAPVATVTVSPASASVAVGAVQQFTAALKDASGNLLTGRAVTWSSNSPTIAGISASGLVTGLLAGPATITATSEGQSGSATVTVVPPGAGGVVFESDWSTATGTSQSAVRDGTRWGNYWEFNNGSGVQLLSVVAGGPPGYANALRVLQLGSVPGYAADLQQDNLPILSTDYYVRFYMRNDDTSPAGDHVVTPDIQAYQNLTYMRKFSGTNGWQFVISLYGCSFIYPISHIGPTITLSHGVWYRFEYFVHFVDATHVQVHPRVYDASGTQILGDADFLQQDPGSAVWNGRSDWTLASLYATGFSYCVNPGPLQSFAVGNNGQQASVNTGLSWYYAGVQIRTDRWPGP